MRGAARADDGGDALSGSLVLQDVAPLGRGWWTAPLAFVGIGARRRHPAELPLEWATAAVCEAYVALGELSAEAMASAQFAVRPEGWVRAIWLAQGAEINRFCRSGGYFADVGHRPTGKCALADYRSDAA